MEKYVGVCSEVRCCGGVPTLYVDGAPYPAAAYMTYLEKFNAYADFAEAGYTFFSVPVLFSGRWISRTDGLTPFKKGIFDEKDKPDFTPLDESVEKILAVCPDAKILPRVNISMPVRWEKENPHDVNILADGTTCRESFYSDKWRADVSEMLRAFVRYVNGTDYAAHIVGYQLAGGNTEEWFHFDLNAGYCENAEPGFRRFMQTRYPEEPYKGLPDLSGLSEAGSYHGDAALAHFLEYASFAVADAITYLAAVVKEETGGHVVVGTFYGYALEVTSPLHGTHALQILLNDPNIDFICSPNSYIGSRDSDADWTEMYPADSVRLHGKMCFQECDIRTHLTVPLPDRDPETDPNRLLDGAIWQGPATKAEAIGNVRKSFCRQLIKGNGLWWFDMWGGWFADPDILRDMREFRKICADSLADTDRSSTAFLAVFTDESAYKYMTDCALRNTVYNQRRVLGQLGTMYDIYDVSDFAAVCRKYKAVVFLSDTKTPALTEALSLCMENGIPYLMRTALKQHFTAKELRAFCAANGIPAQTDGTDLLYINENYAAIHAVTDGEKVIRLNKAYRVTELLTEHTGQTDTDTIRIPMHKGETRLFRLDPPRKRDRGNIF